MFVEYPHTFIFDYFAARNQIMLYWRIAGLNYLQFSRIAARAMRRGLKPEAKAEALLQEKGLIKKTKWEAGKPIEKA
jgi:F-type H+-transporting ATPase subunit epsilon